ncbi:MAG: nucleotide exchange factor GrpE [Holophagaceae bacterium]|nr:nucleotide exchange factor GrpE [Holophagaceae bacterium]
METIDTMETMENSEPLEGGPAIEFSDSKSDMGFDLQAFADEVADFVEEKNEKSGSSELDTLKAKIKELEESLHREDDKNKRLLADFQNYRNRTSRDIQLGIETAEKQILLEILQVLDSLSRCMNSTYRDIDDFRTGVDLIQKQFIDTLRRLKVSEIEIKVGDTFDAHFAEALTTVETTDYAEGSVVEVCEKGFKRGEQLLRPARVVVAHSSNSG